MFSLLKRSVQGKGNTPKLPEIVQQTVELKKEKSAQALEVKDDPIEVEEQDEVPDITKPLYHEFWIRSMDPLKTVYFYNVRTGESSWLGPCGTCNKESHKYCVECKHAYCDTHFKKRHEKKSRQKHHWQLTDIPDPAILKPGQEHCIECSLKEATLMCTECWDGYCDTCFPLVHHLGDLLYHKPVPYQEAKRGWIRVLGNAREPEFYMHGDTNVSTFEKPYELMNPLEKRFFRQFKKVEQRVVDVINEVEQVQFEVEEAKYERDRVLHDAQFELHELHDKYLERPKPKEGNLLDHSKLQPTGMFSSLFGMSKQEALYRSKLLNPTDRHRGEARSEYIKGVLDHATAGIVKHEVKEKKSKKNSKKG